mmetsp:Transcript_10992/g.21492  ORF Transcript_10992/g.21492 Transcript_10992/m.21492 type:complete len:646 (+) Transcript_10992:1238-3175(+)|eukprot:CAMPEP_0171495622 /NCGR_PEP_ID=MMETSP0958-20121227/6245_1 /TAXON_ID=87120 /ORGANISM="Aurantiochytrium limacinum, Strain ATCCMYA-1381" /LENGTH=645 /DNA_ID=CAMNT_0012029627 /DNA_START=1172 /DNA_END=3109 /DNA_ORIENTATION=-
MPFTSRVSRRKPSKSENLSRDHIRETQSKHKHHSWASKLVHVLKGDSHSHHGSAAASSIRSMRSTSDAGRYEATSFKAFTKLVNDLEQGKFDVQLYAVEEDIFESEEDRINNHVLIERGATVRISKDGYIEHAGMRIRPTRGQLRELSYYDWTIFDVYEFVLKDLNPISAGLLNRRVDPSTIHCIAAGKCTFSDFARQVQIFARSRKAQTLFFDFISDEGLEPTTHSASARGIVCPLPTVAVFTIIDSWTYSWELHRTKASRVEFGVGLKRPIASAPDEVTIELVDKVYHKITHSNKDYLDKLVDLSDGLEQAALSDLLSKGAAGESDVSQLRAPVAILRDVLHRQTNLHNGGAFPEAIVLHLELANALLDVHEKNAAMEHCEMALAASLECYSIRSPKHARTLMLVGSFDVERKDFARAQELFESALQICRECDDPDTELEADILSQLGALQFSRHNLGAAKEYLENAAAMLDPNQSAEEPPTAPSTASSSFAAASNAARHFASSASDASSRLRMRLSSARFSSRHDIHNHDNEEASPTSGTSTSNNSNTSAPKQQVHVDQTNNLESQSSTSKIPTKPDQQEQKHQSSNAQQPKLHIPPRAAGRLRAQSNNLDSPSAERIREDVSHNLLVVNKHLTSSANPVSV